MNIKILKSRYALNLTQKDMALLLGVSRNTYVKIESGIVIPKVDLLLKISKLTNKKIAYFYNNEYRNNEKILTLLDSSKGNKKRIMILCEILLQVEVALNKEHK
ncbi:hypothetical protein UA38_00135 [Photobacterium kishitanii]|uniref:XRE family transcriptional regulator n=3 Tax=Photobacterium kishitanii TaxID=318456 RepID=A0AAX0YQ13_9GAMM|nr:helix-turn-helix transcriptional regulator [Photobacterium kishitanii]KJG59626.1 hypothetical protein UA38_00135 [Photobacterium kishitanii]KJG62919.1 hypothetical protein UA42_00480 [Photobacterium kishitanii]KJG68074.1 hypothetical protein UA40_02350 [Photobacterium kishitanii]KJG71092.1 hypothetical protein UA41_00135 [Photobacterium kishitanii]PSV09696.1 XRE family transcriptional regulator [Photobacterium kishitanii]